MSSGDRTALAADVTAAVEQLQVVLRA